MRKGPPIIPWPLSTPSTSPRVSHSNSTSFHVNSSSPTPVQVKKNGGQLVKTVSPPVSVMVNQYADVPNSTVSWADQGETGEIVRESTGKTHNSSINSWNKIVSSPSSVEELDISGTVRDGMNEDEIAYWRTSVVCYLLGSNPPQSVMEGFFNRIWKRKGVDKISQINRGVFLVRFHQEEDRDEVVEEGVQIFDKKPIVVKQWKPDVDVSKETVDKVPVWIRLVGLEVKYWGKSALTKIASLVGQPLRVDKATSQERLTYARLLVEIPLNQEYLSAVRFENEYGTIMQQLVEYE
ncbi:hypothetical protein RND71_010645 [Anisodus tanguticus]|uniref:DUF4283 domain-containing protein n=1 Tax=Anisodus tanguticus TaxID=243964 RepID=A0AAE1VSU9_9SOLA|nr:hypothetical protein RND71_010645 [Anisodus tanguticus]